MMLSKIKLHAGHVSRSKLVKDLSIVALGQLVSQIITFAAMPIITRIYTPGDVGMQGVFVSTSALFVTFATLNFHLAIVLPRSDEDAKVLLRLSIYFSILISIILEILFFVADGAPLGWVGAAELTPYYHLLNLSVATGAAANCVSQYFSRKALFVDQSKITISNSLILSAGRVGFGLVSPTALGLVVANVLANLIRFFQFAVRWKLKYGKIFVKDDVGNARRLFWEYRDFLTLRTPQVVINTLSQTLPIWLLAREFGAGSAGQYSIAIASLAAPTALLGKAMGTVFYPRLAEAYGEGISPRPLIVKATLASLALVFIPYLMIVLFGPTIYSVVFGAHWEHAGEYARWLSFWCMLQLVNQPAVAAASVLNIQAGLLLYELCSTGSKILALWIGFALFASDIVAIALFAVVGILAYVALILWVIFRSAKSVQDRGTKHGNG